MAPLTVRQLDTLEFIRSYQAEHRGIAPTVGEIAEGIGTPSKGAVARLLAQLEERGAIRRIPGRARAIEIVDRAGAEFHLRRILTGFNANGFIYRDDPAVAAAQRFMGGGAA